VVTVTVLLPFDCYVTTLRPHNDVTNGLFHCGLDKQAVGGRPPRYAPAPLLPLWAPKRLAPPSTPQRSSSFHAQYVLTLTAAAA